MPPKKQAATLPTDEAMQKAAAAAAAGQGTELPVETQKPDEKENLPPTGETEIASNMAELELMELNDPVGLEPVPESPWKTVPELSDEEMTVEAANIRSHGKSQMLLRFKIDGRLTGQVFPIESMHYKENAKPGKSFITR